jgi:hypothetical protein
MKTYGGAMKKFEVTVRNRLVAEKRDVNIYHHFAKSANMISHDSSITLALRPVEEDDYLHISVVSGPGKLSKDCVFDLPAWADFEFSAIGNGSLHHSGDRMLLRIPPGPPLWQIKVTRPPASAIAPTEDYIILGDSEHAKAMVAS